MEHGESLRRTKVTAMLADHAEVAEGKLFINGGGWTITGPDPAPFALAMMMDAPQEWAGKQLMVRWELLDDQGHPVLVPTPTGVQPFVIQAQLGVPPAGSDHPERAPLTGAFAINVGPTPIPPGSRYEWRLMIDDETHEDWRLGFNTRPLAQSDVG